MYGGVGGLWEMAGCLDWLDQEYPAQVCRDITIEGT